MSDLGGPTSIRPFENTLYIAEDSFVLLLTKDINQISRMFSQYSGLSLLKAPTNQCFHI